MATYVALIRKEKDSSYGVEFPDFPGCISCGDTLDEAASNAKEALELHVEGLLDDDEDFPEPSQLDNHRSLVEQEELLPILIDIPIVRRNRRVNITMDEGLLARIESAATTEGKTRSGFLADAAREALKRNLGS